MKNKYIILLFIGTVSGIILAVILGVVQYFTSKQVYTLLVNMDYIPLLNKLPVHPVIGFAFHLVFAIVAILFLYTLLKLLDLHTNILMYVVGNTIGGALFYSLTYFSSLSPPLTDIVAWLYWTVAHTIFGFTVGFLIHFLITKKEVK